MLQKKSSTCRVAALLLVGVAGALPGCETSQAPFAPQPQPLPSVHATAVSTSEVVLAWPPPPEIGREIRVERAREDSPFLLVATLSSDALTYRDTGLDAATTYRYRLRVCGAGGCSAPLTVAVTTPGPLLVVTTALPDAVRGVPYTAGLSASGGAEGYTWSVESGSLPAGLALSELGIVSGIPELEQTATFAVRVRSGDGQTAYRDLTLTVLAPAPAVEVTIETPLLAPALAGAPYEVRLRAAGGDGSTYLWSVVEGSLPPGLELTPGGIFAGAPEAPGTFAFTVSVSSAGHEERRRFTLEVVPHDPTRFRITLLEVAPVDPSIRAHLHAAVARWEEVVTGDLPDGQIPRGFFSSTFCGGFGELLNATSVDDLIVLVDISPIDGPGGIVGQAGPCGLRTPSRLPFAGIVVLDIDDLGPFAGTPALTDVIFHEIGHALGFGGLWGALELIVGAGSADPRFTGSRAVAEFGSLGGSGNVPVENTGGQGTADVHWRRTAFGNEIMTGFLQPATAPQPLSRVTIASVADLGYEVNMTAADPFALGAPVPPLAAPARGPPYRDEVLRGPVRFLPLGRGLP